MPSVIFSGNKVKALKKTLSLNGGAELISSTTDPTSVAVDAPAGTLLQNETTGKLYRKNDSGSSTNWSEMATTAATAPSSAYDISNLTISASVAANALTIAIKTAAGADASAGDPIKIGFRNSTASTGTYSQRSIAGALSMTVSSGSTLGTTSGNEHTLWVYAIDSDGAGTIKLGISQVKLDDGSLQTTVAEGGAGAADSNSVIYSDAAYTSKPVRVIARLKSTQTTAGTWAAVPTEISLAPEQLSLTDKVVASYTSAAGQSIDSGATEIIDFGTKVKDSHNAVATGSSWKFVAPRNDDYTVDCSIMYANASFSASGDFISLQLFKTPFGGAAALFAVLDGECIGPTGSTRRVKLNGSKKVQLNTGDSLDIRTEHLEATARSLQTSTAHVFIDIYTT